MSEPKLQIEISNATSEQEIRQLLDICDIIHNGDTVDGYSVEDLPSDSFYEAMRQKFPIEESSEDGKIMYMGSIPKEKEIKLISPAIIAPKFDGCSVALKFSNLIPKNVLNLQITEQANAFTLVAAHSRGSDVGSKRVNSDLFDKMEKLIPVINCDRKDQKIVKLAQSIESISIRCEIVLDQADENLVSAAYVAGKINGSMEVFEEAIDNLRIVAFEIGSITTIDGEEIRIPQNEVYEILSHFYYTRCVHAKNGKKHVDIYLKDYPTYTLNTTEGKKFEELFEKIKQQVKQPLDGLVYSPVNWLYPKDKSETTDTKYGKYAWKEQKETIVTITGLDFTMGKTGDLACMILYKPVKIDSKTYQRAKVSVQKLFSFINDGLGVGAECMLRVHNNINPNIEFVVKPAKPFVILVNCPFCNHKLEYIYDPKDKSPFDRRSDALCLTVPVVASAPFPKHLNCVNKECPENVIQKISNLLSFMYKRTELRTVNQKGKVVRAKLSEAGLRKISDINTFRTRVPNLKEEFDKLSMIDKLMALGWSKTNGNKLIKKMKSIAEIENELCEPLKFLVRAN